jgi:hypothetical protein
MLYSPTTEAKMIQASIKFGVPDAWHLAQSIQCLVQLVHHLFLPLHCKTQWLNNIDLLCTITIEKADVMSM